MLLYLHGSAATDAFTVFLDTIEGKMRNSLAKKVLKPRVIRLCLWKLFSRPVEIYSQGGIRKAGRNE